jgi:ubiquinol-cytochrome c reductase cytochrome c1 subunit
MLRLPLAALATALVLVLALWGGVAGTARAQEEVPPPPHQQWSFEGVFGTYDRAALQRGFQVYKEVCAACHPVKHLYFRDLTQIGYSEDEVKGIAAQVQVTDGPNDTGEMYQRPGRPSDPIPPPFANDQAARAANNGALPPDLSLITKAREGGPDYVYAILTGFKDPPPGVKMNPNMNFDEYFPGHQIAMPPPLSPDLIKYADETPATVPQMAHDVVSFLSWAAEPTLEERHRIGFKVILFLIVATGVFYAAKRKIWSRIH